MTFGSVKTDIDDEHDQRTHINILEYLSILITYALAQAALAKQPHLASHQHPTLNIFTDNATAESWTYKAIASSNVRLSKYISKLACALQINSSLGLHATHLEGSKNVIADKISRITHDSSFPSQIQAIQKEHEEIRNCMISPIPPGLHSHLLSLLSNPFDPHTIQWQRIDERLTPVRLTSSHGWKALI
jgi:hypothetical protein